MFRFMFQVSEAVQLVRDALEMAYDISGSIISKPMEVVAVSDLLDVWCELYNTTYVQMERRPGDKIHEYLIAASELPHSQIHIHKGLEYYCLNFSQVSSIPLSQEISTVSAPKMNKESVRRLIANSPAKII